MSDKLKLVERQNNALHKLNEIASIAHLTPKETLREALIIGKEYFGLEFGIVSHIVGQDYTVEVQSSPSDTLYDGQLFSLGSTYCKTTLEIDNVLAITDVTKSKYVGHPCHKEFELVSYIGAPIRVNSIVYGTINFSSPSPRALEYDKIDDEFMKLLARWAGAFLERQFALDELSFTKKRFEMIFENNASGILLVDESCKILMANKRFCRIVGFTKDELIGHNARLIHIDDNSYETIKDSFLNAKESSYMKLEYKLKRKDGKIIWCEFSGSKIDLAKNQNGIIWSILDITTEKELHDKIEEQAVTDYLTSLHNRRYFTTRLEEEISRIKRNPNAPISLLMFDLDKFKNINDTLGHLTGDLILKKFADILKSTLRKADIVGRIGGEEFAMILPDTDIQNAVVLANRIRDAVASKTFHINNTDVNFTVSIGVTELTTEDTNYGSAMARADHALYNAKANGRNRVETQ